MDKRPARLFWIICCGLTILFPAGTFADGKVFPQLYAQKIETPNQQALIHFADGIEQLVIETSIAGSGTNFAWVVPLPAAPEIKAVSETFFFNVQNAFQSKLIHEVNPYFVGVLFLCGIVFLSWRSVKDEVSWLVDLPLCLAIAAGAWFFTGSKIVGVLILGLALYVRLLTRSSENFGLMLLIGTALAACLVLLPNARFTLIDTLGAAGPGGIMEKDAVTIVSVQRAGVFDSTTIRSTNPHAIIEWLRQNGFKAPPTIDPAVRYYVQQGWVFVASKVRREANDEHTTLHPLAFTFPVKAPIYPARLTGIENGDCKMDLYVFGNQRATARRFQTVRCDRPKSGLRIKDPELLDIISNSTVGAKLSAKLTPAQMDSDIDIEWKTFRSKGARVYSHQGATLIAFNIAIPMAVIGWLLIGASRGGWDVTEKRILRWRVEFIGISIAIGASTFLLLPKVEVIPVPRPGLSYGAE
jgi:hypothetical protein